MTPLALSTVVVPIDSFFFYCQAAKSISGTSMATPHVAGLIAYLISAEGNLAPASMIEKIQEYSVKDALSDVREYKSSDSIIKTPIEYTI
jgi:subtilisin family serine protease